MASDEKDQTSSHLPRILRIYAGKIFDSEAQVLVSNCIISVSPDSGLILSVTSYNPSLPIEFNDHIIDLRNSTVMPGLVDAHVHFFLHPYSETTWDDQLTKESLAERTIRATVHAKQTLLAGFTTVRDLGTEGAGDADMALRKCLSGPSRIIPGPRYFCASRALVCTGSYGPKSSIFPNQEGVDGVTGAEIVDGVDECVKAVRRQVGAGADWIKVYADYRVRSRMADVSPAVARSAIPTFKRDELDAILSTASELGVKVAAHASDWRRIASLPFDTVEHGLESIPEHAPEIEDLAGAWENARIGGEKTIWVPTLSAYYTMGGSKSTQAFRTFRAAIAAGFDNIACGGDTGVFAHGDNSLEMRLMVAAGAPWAKVLAWATIGGWRCVRPLTWEGRSGKERLACLDLLKEDYRVVGDNEVPFGVIRRGFAADIVATTGDLERDFTVAVQKERISFVMKGGKVYKQNGKEVV